MNPDCDSFNLGYYLNLTFTSLVGELNRALQNASVPLNHAQFSILQVLTRSGRSAMSQRQIALALGKDPAAISRGLRYLETAGFVERTPVSGCKNGVTLTQKAVEMQPLIESVIRATVSKACGGISSAEYAAGISFLKKIYETLHTDHSRY